MIVDNFLLNVDDRDLAEKTERFVFLKVGVKLPKCQQTIRKNAKIGQILNSKTLNWNHFKF